MIRKSILELFYEAAHIQRWNDHIRPKGFTELDKQAHKMIIAFVLAKYEESEHKSNINWVRLIEGGIFEFLHRTVITDIKPPVYHKLLESHGDELNRWVLSQLKDKVDSIKGDFFARFSEYLFNPLYCPLEKRILKASHYLATNWEFKIIYNLNSNLYGIEQTKNDIESQLEGYYDLASVQKFCLSNKTKNFIDLVGQLRFQQRWAQSPRVPETSVMGHMLIVAMITYLCSIEIDSCDKRLSNNFYGGLFHDLPEVLTRDIISPVKRSVGGLEELIKEIENTQVEEKIFPLLPVDWHEDIKYFIDDEFSSKIKDCNGIKKVVTSKIISEKYNLNEFSALDGEIIRACDHLAAYIEASLSISYGTTSHHLTGAITSFYNTYQNKDVGGIDFGQLFDYFKV
ncbi:MAG: HD domain-containing protein [Vulcanibacillus sp.]